MKHLVIFINTLLLSLIALTFSLTLQAEGSINQSSNVFNFQQKLAINGNVNAQYKLGLMYEIGEGVEADIEQAKHWYKLAAEVGSSQAEQRNTYLTIREHGYDKAKHAEWLNGIKKDAGQRKPDAVLLLGQLHRQGIGVKKDLNKSLELLNLVNVLGAANVEKEMATIRWQIKAQKKSAQQKQVKRALDNETQLQQVSKDDSDIQQADNETHLEAAVDVKSEKRKKYEAVMQQLRQEQQQIDQQQSEVSGNEMASIDDEI